MLSTLLISLTHHKPGVWSNTVGHSLDSAVREEDAEIKIFLSRPSMNFMIVLPVLTLHSSPIAGLLLVEIISDVVLDSVAVPVQ